MKLPCSLAFILTACLILPVAAPALATPAEAALTFGVIRSRSAVLTAQHWNPILRYVSQRSGVPLRIKLAKSGPEHAAMIRRGELDFIYSNYQFAPDNDTVGYRVMVRPLTGTMRSQIIVPANSPIHSLDALHGRDVVFTSQVAFAGYQVPMDALQRAAIAVRPQFAGTMESVLGQVLSGRAQAAAVSSEIAKEYALRRNLAYRVLWSSEEYPDIPIAAHPAVPPEKVNAVRAALLKMADDPQGREILAASAPLFGRPPPYGFAAASDSEYNQMRRFYQQRLAPQDKP
ncbi:phosphate/phosphite/phosphonate ABC transporter substrate-binding protein [Noviherbaspirillum sedimenti]|uniref:phosphate/phosphite/phosphonate ABC transporter substrate-binding protein n=1 Tax=Noviherbaspirillum sedimenti TaxID=2320865 RepID=UPI0013149446|nr:phosphate/phosphite/phosphonate ABC transporter substrate-binding protein [Noviherbaspirillum sedimenti]